MWKKIEWLEDLSQPFFEADSYLKPEKSYKSEETKMKENENTENQKKERSRRNHEKISPINISILIASTVLFCVSMVMFFL